jgi:hypothetical protein
LGVLTPSMWYMIASSRQRFYFLSVSREFCHATVAYECAAMDYSPCRHLREAEAPFGAAQPIISRFALPFFFPKEADNNF